MDPEKYYRQAVEQVESLQQKLKNENRGTIIGLRKATIKDVEKDVDAHTYYADKR